MEGCSDLKRLNGAKALAEKVAETPVVSRANERLASLHDFGAKRAPKVTDMVDKCVEFGLSSVLPASVHLIDGVVDKALTTAEPATAPIWLKVETQALPVVEKALENAKETWKAALELLNKNFDKLPSEYIESVKSLKASTHEVLTTWSTISYTQLSGLVSQVVQGFASLLESPQVVAILGPMKERLQYANEHLLAMGARIAENPAAQKAWKYVEPTALYMQTLGKRYLVSSTNSGVVNSSDTAPAIAA